MRQTLLHLLIDIGSARVLIRLLQLIKDYPPLLGHSELLVSHIAAPLPAAQSAWATASTNFSGNNNHY
jgi:hypothetical protein